MTKVFQFRIFSVTPNNQSLRLRRPTYIELGADIETGSLPLARTKKRASIKCLRKTINGIGAALLLIVIKRFFDLPLSDTAKLPKCNSIHLQKILQESDKTNNSYAHLNIHHFGGHASIAAKFVDPDSGEAKYMESNIYADIEPPSYNAMIQMSKTFPYLPTLEEKIVQSQVTRFIDIPGDVRNLMKAIKDEKENYTTYGPGEVCSDHAARIIERHLGCRLSDGSKEDYSEFLPGIGHLMTGKTPNKVDELLTNTLKEAGVRDPATDVKPKGKAPKNSKCIVGSHALVSVLGCTTSS